MPRKQGKSRKRRANSKVTKAKQAKNKPSQEELTNQKDDYIVSESKYHYAQDTQSTDPRKEDFLINPLIKAFLPLSQ